MPISAATRERMAMVERTKIRIALIVEGVRQVHAVGLDGNYATFCGLGDEDSSDDVVNSSVAVGEKISCPQCRAMYDHARLFRRIDFVRPQDL